MEPVRVGVLGCGAISGIYFENMTQYPGLKVVAAADLDEGKARAAAEKWGARAVSPQELLEDDEVEIVVNLTVPKVHHPLNMAAIQAGKSVYAEKPLALRPHESEEQLASAANRGVLVGGAPDTFLGAGLQTCRQLIDDGAIGRPIGFSAFMLCPGHESWHPSPAFYYEVGGGPLFDMGPYYVTALVHLLGSVASVQGNAKVDRETRLITSQPLHGTTVPVETPTHVLGLIEFVNGVTGQFTASFDVQISQFENLEIYGETGTLVLPDPNGFGGDVKILRRGGVVEQIPHTHGYPQNSRGLGVLDMAYALRTGREARASGALAHHVVEIMSSILESAEAGERRRLTSRVERPAPMPQGTLEG